jgi:heptosyltransferase-2
MGRPESRRPIDLTQIERILVVRLDEIGDVVLTTPFLRELRRNLPHASITLLVKRPIRNLVELCPYVTEVLTYNPPGPGILRSSKALWQALRLVHSHLWRKHFDMAIAPRWDIDSYYGSMLAFLSGAKYRVSYSERVSKTKRRFNAGLDRLFTHVLDGVPFSHEVERNLDLIRFLGGTVAEDRLEIWVTGEDQLFADSFLEDHGIHPNDFLVAVAPGARYAKRVWPMANFVELGTRLKRNFHTVLIVVGSSEDKPLGEELRLRLGATVIDAAGRTTLRQAAALLKRCRLFIGNDAGPIHMAAAAGLPVIEISCHPLGGSPGHTNSPLRFGPWRVPHVILRPERPPARCSDGCNSDHAHCIRGVSVEQAQKAAASLISRRATQDVGASLFRQREVYYEGKH